MNLKKIILDIQVKKEQLFIEHFSHLNTFSIKYKHRRIKRYKIKACITVL